MFGIPLIILRLFSHFGLSFIAYKTGFGYSEIWAIQILSSIVALIFIEILWGLVALLIVGKLFEFIFGLFVDVIPAEGRTKEEAQVVVDSGEKGVIALIAKKHPKQWTDEDIQQLSKLDWVEYLFFRDRLVNRCEQVREYFTENPQIRYREWRLKEFIENSNVPVKWQEKVFCNKSIRQMIVTYSILIALILVNPLHI